jgi:hypothetical protein
MDYGAIVDGLVSHALTTGQFERVNAHEPKNSPGNGLTAAVSLMSLGPARGQSGLVSTSPLLVCAVRLYTSMTYEPADMIDPNLMQAAQALFEAYSDDFTLDGMVRNVDLLGMTGTPLSARAGYVEQSGKVFRIIDITIPMIINDVFDQAP